MNEAQNAIAFLVLTLGLPAALWSHLSLTRELERRIALCRNCAHCRAKIKEQHDQERKDREEIDRRYRR